MDGKILKMELIEMVAKQVREDLERDALRTIRQKDTEKGKAILDKIDGIDHFMDAIMQACQHGFYKQSGLVRDAEPVPVLRSHSAPQVISSPRKKRAG
jgi:hypothetical protein